MKHIVAIALLMLGSGAVARPIEMTSSSIALATTKAKLIKRPVLIGNGGPDSDACGGYAKVTNLRRDGDNYLAVRDAPDVGARERDRLGPNTPVQICEETKGWFGIVYSIMGHNASECMVSSPVAEHP